MAHAGGVKLSISKPRNSSSPLGALISAPDCSFEGYLRHPQTTIRAATSRDSVALLAEAILPLAQYYAHIEIAAEGATDGDESRQTDLWRAYAGLKEAASNFAMARVAKRADIYPVFRRPRPERTGRSSSASSRRRAQADLKRLGSSTRRVSCRAPGRRHGTISASRR